MIQNVTVVNQNINSKLSSVLSIGNVSNVRRNGHKSTNQENKYPEITFINRWGVIKN